MANKQPGNHAIERELKKILYVEDDANIQEDTVIALETLGNYLVETCNCANRVLDAMARFEPDLILLDIMMPGMDTTGVLKVIRQHELHKPIQVVLLTAKVLNKEIERFKQLGAAEVIIKPYDPASLCEQIVEIWVHCEG